MVQCFNNTKDKPHITACKIRLKQTDCRVPKCKNQQKKYCLETKQFFQLAVVHR